MQEKLPEYLSEIGKNNFMFYNKIIEIDDCDDHVGMTDDQFGQMKTLWIVRVVGTNSYIAITSVLKAQGYRNVNSIQFNFILKFKM